MNPKQLDPDIVNLARAVRAVESGDNFTATGGSGEFGGYQYTPATWAKQAKAAGVNVPLNQATKEDQNKVWYTWAKSKKDAGFNVGEIASMHNAGEGKPDAYLTGNKGTNKYGIEYDTKDYATKVAQKYQQIKQNGYQSPQTTGDQPTDTTAIPETGRKKDWLDTASDVVNSVFPMKNVGDLIGTGIAKLLHPNAELHTNATLGGVAGDIAQNALYFAPVGKIAQGASLGLRALGVGSKAIQAGKVAEIANAGRGVSELVSPGTKIAGKVAAGAATGYGLDVANSFSNNNPDFTPGLGTALGVAAPLAGPALRGAGNLMAHSAGVSTGVGGNVIKTGLEAATEGGASRQAFADALRGKTTPQTIVTDARSALKQLNNARSEAYNAGVEKIEKETFITKAGKTYVKRYDPELKKTLFVPTNLTTKGVKDVATRTLKSIGLEAKGREIDFTKRPSLDAKNIQRVHSFVYNWDDMTPKGLNQLRQEVAGFRKGGVNLSPADNRYNTYIDGLTDNLRNYVGERVPQIGEMNKAYAKASTLIGEIQKGLSLGKNAQTDTAFRKLTSVLRTNNEFRDQLLSQLESEASRNLPEKIAGQQMSELLPRGIMRQIGGAGAIGGVLTGVGIIPILKAAVLTSPRVVGEMLLALGFTRRNANTFARALGARGLLFPVIGAGIATKNAFNSPNDQ